MAVQKAARQGSFNYADQHLCQGSICINLNNLYNMCQGFKYRSIRIFCTRRNTLQENQRWVEACTFMRATSRVQHNQAIITPAGRLTCALSLITPLLAHGACGINKFRKQIDHLVQYAVLISESKLANSSKVVDSRSPIPGTPGM